VVIRGSVTKAIELLKEKSQKKVFILNDLTLLMWLQGNHSNSWDSIHPPEILEKKAPERFPKITEGCVYLVSFDEHGAHDQVLADVLRLSKADSLHQPSLLLLTVLQELVELERPLQSRPTELRQTVNAATKNTPPPCESLWVYRHYPVAKSTLPHCPAGTGRTSATAPEPTDAAERSCERCSIHNKLLR